MAVMIIIVVLMGNFDDNDDKKILRNPRILLILGKILPSQGLILGKKKGPKKIRARVTPPTHFRAMPELGPSFSMDVHSQNTKTHPGHSLIGTLGFSWTKRNYSDLATKHFHINTHQLLDIVRDI